MDVVVYGPLQSVEEGQIRVLGTDFDLSQLSVSTNDLAFGIGRSTYVVASASNGVLVATELRVSDEWAISDGSPVFVQGVVESFDAFTAHARVNGLEIDTTYLGDVVFVPGEQVAILGHTLSDAAILATDLRVGLR